MSTYGKVTGEEPMRKRKFRQSLAIVLALFMTINYAGGYLERFSMVSLADTAAIVTATSLNVRSGPGTTNKAVGKLNYGASVNVMGQTTGSDGKVWYQIRFNKNGTEATGYVRSDYIKFQTSYQSDGDFERYLSNQGFPESYKPALRQLHGEYPNWVFTAQHTNLTWAEVINNESVVGRNLVPGTSPTSWKSMEAGAYNWETGTWPSFDSGSWVAASREIISYYMDPRNFLNEKYIFQFLRHKYNSNIHTIDGIKSMIQGTFLDNTVNVSGSQSSTTTGSGSNSSSGSGGSSSTEGPNYSGGPGVAGSNGTTGNYGPGGSSSGTGSGTTGSSGPGSTGNSSGTGSGTTGSSGPGSTGSSSGTGSGTTGSSGPGGTGNSNGTGSGTTGSSGPGSTGNSNGTGSGTTGSSGSGGTGGSSGTTAGSSSSSNKNNHVQPGVSPGSNQSSSGTASGGNGNSSSGTSSSTTGSNGPGSTGSSGGTTADSGSSSNKNNYVQPGISPGGSQNNSSNSGNVSTQAPTGNGNSNVSLQAPGASIRKKGTIRVGTQIGPGMSSGPGGSTSTNSGTNIGPGATSSGSSYSATNASYAEIIMNAAAQSGVNPYVLTAMILQEQGTQGSRGISGKVPGYEGYYNFFNIEAYKSGSMEAVERGLWFASQSGSYERPWNSVDKAILGGAVYYGTNYVDAGQDTFYLKKFNVQGSNLYKHQYMTNVQAAASEGAKLDEAYSSHLKQMALEFKIPVYLNMPDNACQKPDSNQSPNNRLSSMSVDGFSLSPAFSRDVMEYNVTVGSSVTSIYVRAAALDSTATITGTGNIQLQSGNTDITVQIKAQNGTICQYIIHVIRQNGSSSQTGGTTGPGGSGPGMSGPGGTSGQQNSGSGNSVQTIGGPGQNNSNTSSEHTGPGGSNVTIIR